MAEAKLSIEVYKNATSAWHQYLSDLSPLRPALYRYCRGLTGNTWDADDLVQETLMRGFSILGLGRMRSKTHAPICSASRITRETCQVWSR
jgi:DNA-directed RNA polymerase specialized sigma24 family protein